MNLHWLTSFIKFNIDKVIPKPREMNHFSLAVPLEINFRQNETSSLDIEIPRQAKNQDSRNSAGLFLD